MGCVSWSPRWVAGMLPETMVETTEALLGKDRETALEALKKYRRRKRTLAELRKLAAKAKASPGLGLVRLTVDPS